MLVNKPWLDSYPAGVPAEIDISAYSSINDVFSDSCKRFRDRVAFINMDTRITYGELDQAALRFASWLQHRGLNRVTALP